MKSSLTQLDLQLYTSEIVSLESGDEWTLHCHTGDLWLTAEGHIQDLWLGKGRSVDLSGMRRLVITAENPDVATRVTLSSSAASPVMPAHRVNGAPARSERISTRDVLRAYIASVRNALERWLGFTGPRLAK